MDYCSRSVEGEWNLEELDYFTPISDAWFCSLDSFTTSNNLNLNSIDENDDQFPNCIAAAAATEDHNHIMSMSGCAIEETKMESIIFSGCGDIFLQEILSGFCGEDDRFVNMHDHVQTGHQGEEDNNNNPPANNNPLLLHHHKRKSIDDDDHIITPNKKTRKAKIGNSVTKQKSNSRRRRKYEQEEEEEDDQIKGSAGRTSDNSSSDTRPTRASATDPQSLYARKRRERINERLKLLQKLVPNGTKVDISTMLEEAVQYVKFLQLQIKVLSSDELWMYAPIAYNGMDIGLHQKLSSIL